MDEKKFEKPNKSLPVLKPQPIQVYPHSIIHSNLFSNDSIIPDTITNEEKEVIKSQNIGFYQQYVPLVERNKMLKNELKEVIKQKIEYKKKINKLLASHSVESKKNKNLEKKESNETKGNDNIISNLTKSELKNIHAYTSKKRKRRKKSQINLKFKCSYEGCNKIYSTEGSLKQHIKSKHDIEK